MSQYEVNPNNYAVGDVPSKLTVLGADSGDVSYDIQKDSEGRKYLDVSNGSTSTFLTNPIVIDGAEADGSQDLEVYMESNDIDVGACVAAGGANDNCYWARMWQNGDCTVYRRESGGYTSLATPTISDNFWYSHRFRYRSDGTLRFRAWRAPDLVEPSSWDADLTDTNLSGTTAGVFAYDGGQDFRVYYLGVGTQGDTPPQRSAASGITASRPLADGTSMLDITDAQNLGYPETESLFWWVGYKSADWPEITTSQNYFFLCSTAHSDTEGGIYAFEADDPIGTNMSYIGRVLDSTDTTNGDQMETPQLIYAPNDPNGRVLHLSYHEKNVSAGQASRLSTSSGGDTLDAISWTHEGNLAESNDGSDPHTGYMTRRRLPDGSYSATSLYAGAGSTEPQSIGAWFDADDYGLYTLDNNWNDQRNLPPGLSGTLYYTNYFDHGNGTDGIQRYKIFRDLPEDILILAPADKDDWAITGRPEKMLDLTKTNEGGPKSVLTLQDRDGSPLVQNGELYTYVTYENQGQTSDEPDRVFVYKLSGIDSGAGAVTLTTNELQHAHTLEQSSVSAVYALSTNELQQTHALAQSTVSVGYSLTTNELQQAHTLESPTLTVAGLLTPEDVQHGHTVEDTTLAVQWALTTDELQQTHTLEQSNASVAYALTPQGLQHLHNLDATTLEAIFGLTPDDLSQAHTIESPTGSSLVVLSVDGMTHPHTLDQVVLGTVGFATKIDVSASPIYETSSETDTLYQITLDASPILE